MTFALPQEFDLARGLYDISSLEALIEDGCTLLTPNQRLARRIKAQWDAQRAAAGTKVWRPLSVHALEDWLLGQWDVAARLQLLPQLTPLAHAQVLEVWRQVINEHAQKSADYHLLRTDSVAQIADQARELLIRWQVDSSSSRIQQLFQFEPDCSTFIQWLNMFEQRLATAGQCTPVDCLLQLAQIPRQLSVSRVALVEFGEIAPLLQSALSAVSPQWQQVTPATNTSQTVIHPFSSKRAELLALASWVAQQNKASPDTTIGIVLSDSSRDRVPLEYLLRREFDCLGENYTSLPVNFSSGLPLLQTPLVRDALAALATGSDEIAVTALVDLLHSRFLVSAKTQSTSTHRFITTLYAQGRENVLMPALCDLASGVDVQLANGFVLHKQLRAMLRMRLKQRRAFPSVWVEYFNEILVLWGWPGEQVLDSLEYQQLELWSRTLDEFAAFDAVCQAIDFMQALDLLRDCCARQVFQPQTADSAVQVLGPLEAAGLAFDHLWVCGMQATDWPSAPQPNPFIPVLLQTQFRLPHANSERELAFSRGILDQYARTSGTLHASYCRQLDGIPELPSALIKDFASHIIPEPDAVAAYWSLASAEALLVPVDDHRAPPLETATGVPHAGGSALLEDQSQCPFRAFARHRLRVKPLPDFYTALSPGERGTLLHAALSTLWDHLGDSAALMALTSAQEQQLMDAATESAVEQLPTARQRKLSTAFWSLEKARLAALLQEWLAVERLRNPFTVMATEHDGELQLANLTIRLRADRIDQLPDGSQVVIDYKSGESSVREWLGLRPARPQLPLYAMTGSTAVAALAFAQVRPRQCRFVGLGQVAAAEGISTDIPLPVKSDTPEQDWLSLQHSWQGVLEGLAHEFIDGQASVDPYNPSRCAACGLQSLCRIETEINFVAEQAS